MEIKLTTDVHTANNLDINTAKAVSAESQKKYGAGQICEAIGKDTFAVMIVGEQALYYAIPE